MIPPSINLPNADGIKGRKSAEIVFWTAFATASVVLLAVYVVVWGFLGGWQNYDTLVQWQQVQSGAYDEWHPFAHTFLMMKLPSLVWNDYRAAVIWQILTFSGVFGFLASALYRAGVRVRWLFLSLLLTLLHPQTVFFMMTPFKDTAFGIFVLFAIAAAISKRGACLAIALSGALCMRHNGVFFVLPFICLWMMFRGWRTLGFRMGHFVLFVVLTVLVKGGLPHVYSVRPASSDASKHLFIESAGLPLTMMGAVYVAHPERVPSDARQVLESIRPRQVWLERYRAGSFNLVKYAGVAKLPDEMIRGVYFPGWIRFLKLCAQTACVDPALAGCAFVRLTDQAWNPFSFDREALTWVVVKIGLGSKSQQILDVLNYVSVPVLGIAPLSLWGLIVLLGIAVRRRWPEGVWLSAPILCYHLGTMCFLSGFTMQRLFFCDVLVIVPLLAYWFGRAKEAA